MLYGKQWYMLADISEDNLMMFNDTVGYNLAYNTEELPYILVSGIPDITHFIEFKYRNHNIRSISIAYKYLFEIIYHSIITDLSYEDLTQSFELISVDELIFLTNDEVFVNELVYELESVYKMLYSIAEKHILNVEKNSYIFGGWLDDPNEESKYSQFDFVLYGH